MNPEDATRFDGLGQLSAGKALRRRVPWDVLAFWMIWFSVWGFVLGSFFTWLWEKVAG